jgi:hypothetical protein
MVRFSLHSIYVSNINGINELIEQMKQGSKCFHRDASTPCDSNFISFGLIKYGNQYFFIRHYLNARIFYHFILFYFSRRFIRRGFPIKISF